MLPFLKKMQEGSASMPVEPIKRKSDDEESEYDMLESASEDLISAVHSNDTKGFCRALRAAFEMLDMEPYEDHENE
jgi:hypothetical protein